VYQQLSARYGWGASQIPNAIQLQVKVAPDTTLVVCKGLVADRLSKIKSGRAVLGWRCCRASYGTRCRVKYDAKNPAHFGQTTARDPLDGKLYIENVVDWYVVMTSGVDLLLTMSGLSNKAKQYPLTSPSNGNFSREFHREIRGGYSRLTLFHPN
jgi:hypothetical protein